MHHMEIRFMQCQETSLHAASGNITSCRVRKHRFMQFQETSLHAAPEPPFFSNVSITSQSIIFKTIVF